MKEADIRVQLYRVSDGEQALAFLRCSGAYEKAPKPDLILLDLNLPRKSGLEVLSEMQHDARLRDIIVIVFTSSALSADKRRSLALGAQEYLRSHRRLTALWTRSRWPVRACPHSGDSANSCPYRTSRPGRSSCRTFHFHTRWLIPDCFEPCRHVPRMWSTVS